MELKEYQEKAKTTAIYPNIGRNLIYPVTGLGGETGELLNKLQKLIRSYNLTTDSNLMDVIQKPKPRQLTEGIFYELGDILWFCALVAEELGTDLDKIAEANLDKLSTRVKNNTVEGSGDTR